MLQIQLFASNVRCQTALRHGSGQLFFAQLMTEDGVETVGQGFAPLGLDYSPVKGPEGNIEFLLFLQKTTEGECSVTQQDIQTVVSAAHDSLGGNV